MNSRNDIKLYLLAESENLYLIGGEGEEPFTIRKAEVQDIVLNAPYSTVHQNIFTILLLDRNFARHTVELKKYCIIDNGIPTYCYIGSFVNPPNERVWFARPAGMEAKNEQ